MFETVAPELVGRRSRKVFYESLPFSIGAHAVVAVGIVTAQVWTLEFPTHSPRLYTTYSLTATPPPPPPPPPPRAARPEVTRVVVPPQVQNLAPTIIPDTIPEVFDDPPPVVEGPIAEGDPSLYEGGVEGGVAGGIAGGVVPPTPAPAPAPEPPPQRDVVTVERDAILPLQVISQEYPSYPEEARSRGWQDSLIVRYVIGRDGRVREVTTIRPPAMRLFEEEAHKKIRQWRFRPLIENGEPKEVIHELTVEFKIVRSGR